MTITVRPAAEDDVMALIALYTDLHPDDPVLPNEQAVRIWREISSQAGRAVLIAFRDCTPVGTVEQPDLPADLPQRQAFRAQPPGQLPLLHREMGSHQTSPS